MRYLINDEGRDCTRCNEFKQWDEYGNHKKGTRGKRSLCLKCNAEDSYIRIYGCLKEDNIDPKHHDADKIMDKYINRAYREKRRFYKELFKKEKVLKRGRYDDLGRECNDCGRYKYWKFFSSSGKSDSPNRRRPYCKDCAYFKSLEYRKKNPKTRKQKDRRNFLKKRNKANRIEDAIKLAGDNLSVSNGFIYLYRCEELDCFKIGRTKDNPFDYVKIKSSSSGGNYGLDLKMVAYIVSPVRDCDAEWLATKSLKHKKVKHQKPCGGYTHELFRCGLYEALLILRGISNRMYIEPNPFVSLDDLDAVEIVEHTPAKRERYYSSDKYSGVVARRMLREVRNNRQWNIKDIKEPNGDGVYTCTCECRQVKQARCVYMNKTGLSFFIVQKKTIYLGRHGLDKELIIDKFKSVYDLRDSLFVNGRYAEGSVDIIREEVRRVKGIL